MVVQVNLLEGEDRLTHCGAVNSYAMLLFVGISDTLECQRLPEVQGRNVNDVFDVNCI